MRDRDHSIPTPPSVPSALTAPPIPPPLLPPLPAPPPPALPPLPTVPAAWEDTTGFRETFLVQLEPEEAAAWRRAGRHLHDLACEHGRPDGPESYTRLTLRAILADLRHAEGLLAHVARQRITSDLDPEDDALAAQAALRGLALHCLVEALDADLGPSPPAPAAQEPAS